jgi:hypothetical protein
VWWQPQPTLRGTFRRFVVFSRYNVWAGRQRYWHYGLARTYVISLLFCGLALLHNPWWLVAPLLILLARTARSIWQRRERRGLRWLSNPIQFFGVATLLVTIDVASFVGWLQALRQPAKEGLNAS